MGYSNKTLIASVGTAVALGASLPANSNENPFSSTVLTSGYEIATPQEKKSASDKKADKSNRNAIKKEMKEGKCGEGMCGEAMMADKAKENMAAKATEGKCGEGMCGEAMMADKAKENMAAKATEGKCGEGMCGEAMMADKAKEKMSDKAKKTREKSKEGKCGAA